MLERLFLIASNALITYAIETKNHNMKKLLLLLLFTVISQAQIVNIPDANFKAKLISLGKDLNADGEIQVSEAGAVTILSLANANISSLEGIQSFSNLVQLRCENNSISMLNVSGMQSLLILYVYNNMLNSLDVSGCVSLRTLICSNNQLTTLDLSGTNVNDLSARENALQSVTLSQTQLPYDTMNLDHNQLQEFDLSNLIISASIGAHLEYNNLQTINLQGTKAEALWLQNNNLSSVDLSSFNSYSISIPYINLSVNPNLQSVFAKNGQKEDFSFSDDTSLIFVCADESQLQDIEQDFAIYAIQNAVVSPYCVFTPGGNYNTITGNITFDADNNGCDISDPDQPYVKLNLTSGNNNYAVFTSPDGTYSNFGQTGTFNVSVAMENASLFTITPPLATIIFGNANNNISTQDFCITANGVQNDLETVIVPIIPARPGFDAIYKIIYKNKGNQILSGNVEFNYLENELDFVNASMTPDAQSSGMLSWNFTNLFPFESRSFTVTLNVNSPQEAPAVNIGDQLNFSAQVNPLAGDVTPIDNVFAIKQTVVGSLDPNDITCLEGEHVNPTQIGDYLHYHINFENTGTAAAENIVVKNMIDLTKFDISSLQVLNASHLMTPRITNDKVEFIFENINLGASEHGNVTFKIKTKNTLVTGNTVSQKADIYFDYNFPVATNVAMTTFDTLSTNELIDNNVSIYPNPANGIINIKSDNIIKSIQLTDMRGRNLQSVLSADKAVDIAAYPNGIYLLKVVTDKGIRTQKVIKE
jgi:type IX secretion system substrate protein